MVFGYRTPWTQDLCSGSLLGAMNISFNAAIAHMCTWPKLGMTPLFGGGLFNSYSNMGTGMEFLCDPRYTMAQSIWNSKTGNTGFMASNGVFPGFGAYTSMNPWNFTVNNTTPSDKKDDKGLTEEEKKKDKKEYEKKVDTLKSFLESIKTILSRAYKNELETLFENLSDEKTYKDKYDKLLEFYNKINKGSTKEKIQRFIVEDSGKFMVGKTPIIELIGYPSGKSYEDSVLAGVHDRLNAKGNADSQTVHEIDEIGVTSADTVLTGLSEYNTKYSAIGNDSLINLLYKAMNDSAQKETAKEGLINMNGALIDKANEIKEDSDLDDETVKALDKAIKALSQYNSSDKLSRNKNNIINAFNHLYVLTRVASAKLLEQKINDEYGEFDENIGNFVTAKTVEDLKQEGLEEEYNNLSKDIQIQNDDNKDNKTNSDIDNLKDNKKIIEELGDGIITQKEPYTGNIAVPALNPTDTSKAHVTLNNPEIYTINTESKDNKLVPHYYVLTDDNMFVEVYKKNPTDVGYTTEGKALVKPSEIKKQVQTAKESIKTPEEIAQENEDALNGVGIDLKNGSMFYEELDKKTSVKGGKDPKVVYANINTTLENLDKDNVQGFMNEYYEALIKNTKGSDRRQRQYDRGNLHEGLIERMDDERDKGGIEMKNKLNLISSFMEMIKEKAPELMKTQEYKHIFRIYNRYTNAPADGSKDRDLTQKATFNTTCDSGWWGRGWKHTLGRLFGDKVHHNIWHKNNRCIVETSEHNDHHKRYYDNETLDYCMLELLKQVNKTTVK